MPGRRASQQRAEERVKNDEATKETGGSQGTSKKHAQGRGHGKHTGSGTPQQSTREGGTRGTSEGQHPAPGHPPHRHHTHRTRPHPHPRHAASGPRQPAQRAGSREEGAPEPRRPRHPRGAQPPTGHAGHRAGAGPPRPHTCAHSTWVADLNSPPGGRAAGRGGAPDPRRPSQRRSAPPPGTPFRHPHGTQCRPARARAVGPVLGPHAHTNRTLDTPVAEPWPPAAEDGRPGEGQRLTPDAPHNGGRPPPPPRTAPYRPRGTQLPQGMQAKGTVLGPHTHTAAPRAPGWRTPTARPVGGQSGEGQRLTSDALTMVEGSPPGDPLSATPTASNASPQGRTLSGRCWVPTPAPTAAGTHGSRNPGRPLQRTGGQGRDSA